MKFALQTISHCSGRLGVLSEIERIPGISMETPMIFLHTKGGVVPNLTHETLQMTSKENTALSVSVETTLQCLHPTSELQKPLAEFIGMKEYLLFCGVHNTAVPFQHGYNGKLQVSLWTKSGREVVDAERYMDIIETFQPDFYQTLFDGDTDQDSSKKRTEKAVESNYLFFKTCMRRHGESKALKKSTLLGTIGGGYNVSMRANAARRLAKEPIKGFVIDGFCAYGSIGESLSSEEISPLIVESLKYLPCDSFRMAPGCWSPELVWQLVKHGIDAFDTSLPSAVAARGAALTFRFDPETGSFTYNSPSFAIPLSTQEADEKQNMQASVKEQIPKKYEINLLNPLYRDCLEPILPGCQCVTCTDHTKAYVHHLLITRELLAPVLLMIHNLHHYNEFFKEIRQAIKIIAAREP